MLKFCDDLISSSVWSDGEIVLSVRNGHFKNVGQWGTKEKGYTFKTCLKIKKMEDEEKESGIGLNFCI